MSEVTQLIEALLLRGEYASRLEFLYKIVEDTQGTIRFIDTKAAFCVTILTGMLAGELQLAPPGKGNHLHLAAFFLFIAAASLCLLVCLRVIFPVIKLQGTSASSGHRGPKFFIGHHKRKHWFLHTFSSHVGAELSENHDSYLGSLENSTDSDLLCSMCDEVLMICLIRQVKADRLHAAMITLGGVVPFFLLSLVV